MEEPRLRLLRDVDSVYALANEAIASARPLTTVLRDRVSAETLSYDDVYQQESDWQLLPPIDHPGEPSRCLVSGTGLTHLGSAKNRDAMHGAAADDNRELTDSMRMFRLGLDAGRPDPGQIGAAPEWFYKGTGAILHAHGQPLIVPSYAEDGGEEAEIAGVYVIGPDGQPRRVGMAVGNEFSDHRFEKRNYLNLAGSKIRTCALGPELVIDADFQSVPGEVTIERGEKRIWFKSIATGESEMCHNLANIEHHHFKFETHRRPGDVHVHFFGAHSLSFGDGVTLIDGDVMTIKFDGFGRPLRNPLRVSQGPAELVSVLRLA